jgi:hypothetical protein
MDPLAALSPNPASGFAPPRSPEDEARLRQLQARDRQVKAHEQAHLAAAGGLARGGAAYTYEKGPDGRLYATGGEVSLDASPIPDNPAATLAKARQIQAAASAPADPSGQDRAVAAAAAQMAAKASRELARQPERDGRSPQLDLVG